MIFAHGDFTRLLVMDHFRGLARTGAGAALVASLGITGCRQVDGIDPADPGRGPGQMVGNGDRVSAGDFAGGADARPAPADTEPPAPGEPTDCDAACRAYCDALPLENPVNRGMCSQLWGVGLQTRPIDHSEACRRLFVDFVGRYPTATEVNDVCLAQGFGSTVHHLQAQPDYLLVNQRRWADKLLYNNRTVNVERIYDMDNLVGKTYDGRVSWDQFAAVTSAHPAFVRRLDGAADRASALFQLFLGRPPYHNERSDMARLYTLWQNGYWEHPYLGLVPDPYIEYACVDNEGQADPAAVGQCTSVLWGHQELVLAPDGRREDTGEQAGMMWSGKLTAAEWERLQAPGRVVTRLGEFWEWTVDEALRQLLGYDLGRMVPQVRQELVEYLVRYNGDIRALHFAIATSAAYLQSSRGDSPTDHRWTFGPLKQMPAEPWIDSVTSVTGVSLGACDHRISHPEDYLDEEVANGWTFALVNHSRWETNPDKELRTAYRSLAQTLGGCPTNEVGGRFTTVSILNTAVQEAFVAEICDPSQQNSQDPAAQGLLPAGVSPSAALDEAVGVEIVRHQTRRFFGREATPEEIDAARVAAAECSPAPCDATAFARPLCFALASSSEMLFY
ncbi:MAG: hypothetical protein B7733_24355 [Myxococcales bacterium FL481]|nr:MAG: hypothetical protein B7733_24355 [Myxococcales bacterium FL481]